MAKQVKLHVVVTVTNENETDVFNDIVQITRDKKRAAGLEKALQNRDAEELKKYGVNADFLTDYENAHTIIRYLNGRF